MIVFFSLTSTLLGCTCAMGPVLWGSCVNVSLHQRLVGEINALKPARCLGGSVGGRSEGNEVALLFLRPLKLHAYARGHKGNLNL